MEMITNEKINFNSLEEKVYKDMKCDTKYNFKVRRKNKRRINPKDTRAKESKENKIRRNTICRKI